MAMTGKKTLSVSSATKQRFDDAHIRVARGFRQTDDSQLDALLDAYDPIQDPNIISEKWERFFREAYASKQEIRTMWTLKWPVAGNAYRSSLAQEEAGSACHVMRIIAHRPIQEVLGFLSIHLDSFVPKRTAGFELFLPWFSKRREVFNETDLFASSEVSPRLEIVVRGHEAATLTYQRGTEDTSPPCYLEIRSEDFCRHLLVPAWQHFSSHCVRLDSRDKVWRWLVELDSLTDGFRRYQPSWDRDALQSHELHHLNAELTAKAGQFNWDKIADKYDTLVRVETRDEGGLPFFWNYFQAESQVILDQIAKLNPGRPVSFVDFGCGTGSLIRIVSKNIPEKLRRASKSVVPVLGVDSSIRMLSLARGKLVNHNAPRGVTVGLRAWDLLNLNRYMTSGRILRRAVGADGSGTALNEHFVDAFNESRKFAFAASVLPNVLRGDWEDFVNRLQSALGPGDHLMLTTYDGDQFATSAKEVYRHVSEMTGPLDERYARFEQESRLYTNSKEFFFSYWPRAAELGSVLKKAGLQDVLQGTNPGHVPGAGVAWAIGSKPMAPGVETVDQEEVPTRARRLGHAV